MRITDMPTTTTHPTHSKEHEEKEHKSKAQIDAERAEKGEEVPKEEQGKPTEAREWLASERERQAKIDRQRFESEYNAKLAAKDQK